MKIEEGSFGDNGGFGRRRARRLTTNGSMTRVYFHSLSAGWNLFLRLLGHLCSFHQESQDTLGPVHTMPKSRGEAFGLKKYIKIIGL